MPLEIKRTLRKSPHEFARVLFGPIWRTNFGGPTVTSATYPRAAKRFRCRQKHACDQNAECDVVERVHEIVHDGRPSGPRPRRIGAAKGWCNAAGADHH